MFEKFLFRPLATLVAVTLLATASQAVTIETVPVGNPGNDPDDEVMLTDFTSGYGRVDYEYRIGKYEVTNAQYVEFLNAVADTDTYGLYNAEMWSNTWGCKIERSGSSGSYTYSVAADRENRPVSYVSWGDAARFANWLHNGQPGFVGYDENSDAIFNPVPQDENSTEDGSYELNGAIDDTALIATTRESDATWVIPTENE